MMAIQAVRITYNVPGKCVCSYLISHTFQWNEFDDKEDNVSLTTGLESGENLTQKSLNLR